MNQKLGAWMNGGLPGGKRGKDDHYPTPPAVTQGLLQVENVPKRVWEPAAGSHAMVRVLEANGIEVVATTLNDYGFGGGLDFLQAQDKLADAVITNPPFNVAEGFIRAAHRLGVGYMALLLKGTYWHAAERRDLWELWQPSRVWALTWRADFLAKGAPAMEAIWCVWDSRSPQGKTEYLLMPRPKLVIS